jgi:hypothetical protein
MLKSFASMMLTYVILRNAVEFVLGGATSAVVFIYSIFEGFFGSIAAILVLRVLLPLIFKKKIKDGGGP